MIPPTPTLLRIKQANRKFDKQNSATESAVAQLFRKFPTNTLVSQVLLKVLVLNKLYSTQIRDIDIEIIARHIVRSQVDGFLNNGLPKAVELVAKVKIEGKIRNEYSFATKYCNWHNRNSFAMYDSNVDDSLWAYKKKDAFANFYRKDLWDYDKFLQIIKAFRSFYDLSSVSFKRLDKFLWLLGKKLRGVP
jgi:hypothetical protein